MHLVRRSDSFK